MTCIRLSSTSSESHESWRASANPPIKSEARADRFQGGYPFFELLAQSGGWL